MLQITGVVSDRDMRAQYLDRMDIERERGITIKSQAVRMPWEIEGETFALNMIDTPGHVDFTYEVSRSLAACEGAILLVDAAQGIEAQTLANPALTQTRYATWSFTESPVGLSPQFQWKRMLLNHVHQRSRRGTVSSRLRGRSSASICSSLRGGRRPT